MSTSSVNGRLQGSLNQPHGIPQLDKDRKIEPGQLRINEVNGVAGLDAAVEIPMALLKTDVANGLAGLDAAVEIPMALLKTDVANGLAKLNPSKRIINDVPVSLLVDTQDQSFINLLKNGDFESWSAGAAAAPDGWALVGAGAAVAREDTIIKENLYSATLTRGGADCYLIQNAWVNYGKSRTFSLGAWVYASVAGRAKLRMDDGVAVVTSNYHTGSSTWEWLTLSSTLNAAASALWGQFMIDTGDTTAHVDGMILVEGSVCPAFGPHPTDQTPIVLTSAPTDAGTNGETRWYAVVGAGGARRLYMSNGTDWKYIAIST